nr:CatA-like O-acetyltransferase [Thermoanaerobaculia bacterium]
GKLEPRWDRDDLIHYSVLPWVAFTSFAHARKHNPGDSVPKIVFGRHQDRAGRRLLPVSVEVHHALVDGLHVGRFFARFQHYLDELPLGELP